MKRLYLVRHAKSSWADPSLADSDRPLNKRGRRDTPEMGKRLAKKEIAVDAIWHSPALRAQETARLLAKALFLPRKKMTVREEIYGGTVDDLLHCIHTCPDKVDSLLLVGHNPMITDFANLLVDESEEEIAWLPTCGVVALEFSCSSWEQLRKGQGRLLFIDFPKNVDSRA